MSNAHYSGKGDKVGLAATKILTQKFLFLSRANHEPQAAEGGIGLFLRIVFHLNDNLKFGEIRDHYKLFMNWNSFRYIILFY